MSNKNPIKKTLTFPLLSSLFSLLFSLFSSSFLPAWDFGFIVNQNVGLSGFDSDDNAFKYSGNLVPRVSGLIGENSDYYISAGFEAAYEDEWSFIPELLRTEFTWRSRALALTAGRMEHSDPLGLVAQGLFDGLAVSYDSSVGSFRAGAWYTGLLYKKRINIEMTAADYILTNGPLDTDDFADTYFAPKRLLASLGWEHLSLGRLAVSTALLGQFDFSDEDPLNSQYLAAKVTLPAGAFNFDLGGCLQLIQQEDEFGTAFEAEMGIGFIPETSLRNKISFLARYASGKADSSINAFLPVTTISQGDILEAKLSGISMIALDYIARLHNTFSAGLSSSYFIRSDLETYGFYPLSGENSGGYLLGNEFFARLLWSPVSDIQVNLGGGIFLPSMGNAAPDAAKSWRVELKLILFLY
jgi:hypothetical protein